MILNKTVYLPIPIVCSALLVWSQRAELKRISQLRPVVVYLVVTAAVVAPWTLRNYVVTGGKLVPVQSLFWELNVQDVLYYDLTKGVGLDRPEGITLDYFIQHERQILVANGASPDYTEHVSSAKWEYTCEQVYRKVYLEWLKQDPGKILGVKVRNIWNFWVRAENRQKTLLLTLMQAPFLGAVIASLATLLYKQQLHRVKFGLAIVLVLWAEHFLVFAWGRFSLDLVPILGLIFGVGVAAMAIPQPNEHSTRLLVEAARR